jgi:NAD(P)-dependent dehydrogenase (short-subunit alcohol dehydrogenase family)
MYQSRVALVTGANRGLGLEISRQLAKQEIAVIMSARDEKKAKQAGEELNREGLDVHPVKLDVENSSDIDKLPAFIGEKFGRLDILVNNAGISDFGQDTTTESFRGILETNVVGPFALIKTLLPLLKNSPAGRIVNQSSILGSLSSVSKGQGGSFTTPGYCVSKAALNMLTVVLAFELKGTRVKVNASHPGWVQTDMGGPNAPLQVAEGAKTAVTLATLSDDGPTGVFLHSGKPLPW